MIYKIGEFSMISKTTVKTLRFYEEKGLIKPREVDKFTGYRYYDSEQISEVSEIISYREAGLSLKEIKEIKNGGNLAEILENKRKDIGNSIETCINQLARIDKILKEQANMQNKITVKTIPEHTLFYKDGVIKNFGEIVNFVLVAGSECAMLNPTLKCTLPDYCYISYLDGEYKDKDIKVRYAQAVEGIGKENEHIKFMIEKTLRAVCIEHRGAYENLRESYKAVMKYIDDNGLKINGYPREQYIDGAWNKTKVEDYLTEIQIPVE